MSRFLVIAADGKLLKQYNGNFMRVAHEVAHDFPEGVTFDGDVQVEQEQAEYLDNPIHLPVASHASPKKDDRIETPREIQRRFHELTGIGVYTGTDRGLIDHDRVMSMTEDQCMERLRPWLPNGKNYDTFAKASSSILAANYKTGKAEEGVQCWDPWRRESRSIPPSLSVGLNLMPANYLTGGAHPELGAQHLMRIAQEMGHPMLLGRGNIRPWVPLEMKGAQARRFTMCPGATKDCIATCLAFAGRNDAGIQVSGTTYPISRNQIPKARLTEAFLAEPEAFLLLVRDAIRKHREYCRAKDLRCFVRLNVLSDIPWEVVYPEILQGWGPDVIFYDYTKIAGRNTVDVWRDPDRPYHLTFSYGGGEASKKKSEHEMGRGVPVAMVFYLADVERGTTWSESKWRDLTFGGHKVFDGDCHDLRPFDPPEALLVGLKYKTPKKIERAAKVNVQANKFLVKAESTDHPGLWVVPAIPRLLHADEFE